MIYGVKYRLEFSSNEHPVRLDIEKKDYLSSIFEVEGTGKPLLLKYNNDAGDKSGYFRTTQASINLFETKFLNIDELLTSDEEEYRVKIYVDGLLEWVGFLIPDFYEVSIDTPRVISMTASDRLGTLKGAQLENEVGLTPIREVLKRCLLKTGLDIDLNTLADFTPTGEAQKDFYKQTKIFKERFYDKKGKAKSCYDIIKSILILTNSFITQYRGAWYILNKYQVDNDGGFMYNRDLKIPFTRQAETIDFVNVGGRRLINPPYSRVGVIGNFGGRPSYPTNNNFSSFTGSNPDGWTSRNGFVSASNSLDVISFDATREPIYGNTVVLQNLLNKNTYPSSNNEYETYPYLESSQIKIESLQENKVDIGVELNVLGSSLSTQRFAVIATNGTEKRALTVNYGWKEFTTFDDPQFMLGTSLGNVNDPYSTTEPVVRTFEVSAELEAENVNDWTIKIRIYGAGSTTFINFASIIYKSQETEQKGNIFEIRQGVNFTKEQDFETTLFSDYRTKGINGYFYDYPSDDTSSIFANISGNYESRGIGWTAPSSTEMKPLLMHSVNQRAQMFSAPHDILTVTRKGKLNPLNTFNVCGKKHIFIEGEYDFFRNESRLVIEEVKYNTLVERTDYIYSYFDEESTRSSEKKPIFENEYEVILSNQLNLPFDAYRKPNEMIDLRPTVLRNGVAISDFSDFSFKWLNGDGDEILPSELYADLIMETSRTARIDKSYICDEYITVQAFKGGSLVGSDTVRMLRVYNTIETIIRKPPLPSTLDDNFLLEVIISDQYGKVPTEAFDITWVAYTDTDEHEIAYGGKSIVRDLNIGEVSAIIPELKKKRCFGALEDDTYTYTDEDGKILTDVILEL